ncbi:MAG: DUF2911 domain-containing protein [Pyrinomonadaceae bacterium]|nr:DUF2911 domain-containing protein [Pyrinomonadaceae bacterium]
MRFIKFAVVSLVLMFGAGAVLAQPGMPKSPRGMAATQIGGKWITVDYGRPILRGRRDIFGSGADYGKKVSGGGSVWRFGANKSTRFMTETDLMFGDKKLPAGEYSMFAMLKEGAWTLVFSNHKAKNSGREPGEGIWGAYGYDKSKDVLRVPMNVMAMQNSVDQFTIIFMDVTEEGGMMGAAWDKSLGVVAFKVAAAKKE